MSPHDKTRNIRWVEGAFSLTAPAAMRVTVVCDDDCPNCPLYLRGCAGRCVRWDDLVCSDCPCLGSKYADKLGEPKTVNPKTKQATAPPEALLRIRELRKMAKDGQKVVLQ